MIDKELTLREKIIIGLEKTYEKLIIEKIKKQSFFNYIKKWKNC